MKQYSLNYRGHFRRGSFTPIRFLRVNGEIKAIRAGEPLQEGRLMFEECVCRDDIQCSAPVHHAVRS